MEARIVWLLQSAFEGSRGLLKREAGLLLARRLSERKNHSALVELASRWRRSLGPDWTIGIHECEAHNALGKYRDLSKSLSALRKTFPSQIDENAALISYYECAAEQGLATRGWEKKLRPLLVELPFGDWTARALQLAETNAQAFSPALLAAARMRVALAEKNYGQARALLFGALSEVFTTKASPILLAEAGRVCLYSKPGETERSLFGDFQKEAQRAAALSETSTKERERLETLAWTALFYRARMAQALGSWSEARSLFAQAAEGSRSEADRDASLWYYIEASAKSAPGAATGSAGQSPSRRAALNAMRAASASWSKPSRFSDLAGGLVYDAMAARDWELIADMDSSLAPRLDPELAARVSYVAARLRELGLWPRSGAHDDAGRDTRTAETRALFQAIASRPEAPQYYRALAAWRAGTRLGLFSPTAASEPQGPAGEQDGARGSAKKESDQSQDASLRAETEKFIEGFIDYGLQYRAFAECRARIDTLDADFLRRLAARFADNDKPDLAARAAVLLLALPGIQARRSDYEFLFPRPYADRVESASAEFGLPELLLYALMRAESFFKADAVSRVGAIGLTQLMPDTAAETARGLRMQGYDLENPRDNIRIGAAYFARLLKLAGERPLRAAMSYNAGRARLRRWATALDFLPDDLLLESIDFAETRQHSRTILYAAIFYGELYYGITSADVCEYLVRGATLPEKN